MTLLIIVPIIEALPNMKLSCETKKKRKVKGSRWNDDCGKWKTLFDDSFEAAV
jgi:hypothetical protein